MICAVVNRDYPLTDDEENRILKAADLVTLARSGVELDYWGDVIDAHAPEMPTCLAKQLTQIMRGALAIGMDRTAARKLVLRCARIPCRCCGSMSWRTWPRTANRALPISDRRLQISIISLR